MAETIDRQTHRTETAHQHPIEKCDNTLKTVQTLEARLETQHWEVGCEKWVENENTWRCEHTSMPLITWSIWLYLVSSNWWRWRCRTLVSISMCFGLSLLTALLGYKMRKHIGKALQSRSQAIQMALERYNNVVCALDPPCAVLRWEQVIDYAFLSDFNLLRDPGMQEDI